MASALEEKMESRSEETINDPEYDKIMKSYIWMDKVVKSRDGIIPILIPHNKEKRTGGDFDVLKQDLISGYVGRNISDTNRRSDTFEASAANWRAFDTHHSRDSDIIVNFNNNQLEKIINDLSLKRVDINDFNRYKHYYIRLLHDANRHYGKQHNHLRNKEDIKRESRQQYRYLTEPEPVYVVFGDVQYGICQFIINQDMKLEEIKKLFDDKKQICKIYSNIYTIEEMVDYDNMEQKKKAKHDNMIYYAIDHLFALDMYKEFRSYMTNPLIGLYNKKQECRRIIDSRTEIVYTYGLRNTFNMPTLVIEIRAYQIKIYYILYIIVSNLYDTWHALNGMEIPITHWQIKGYIREQLQKDNCFYYYDKNIQLIESVYINIIRPFILSTANKETKIINLFSAISTFINTEQTKLKNIMKEKYVKVGANFNLYLAITTHRRYVLFNKHIDTLVNITLKEHFIYLYSNKRVKFNTLTDPKLFNIYLNYVNYVNEYLQVNNDVFADELSSTEITEAVKTKIKTSIKILNDKIRVIKLICSKYDTERYEFNINALDPDQKALCENLFTLADIHGDRQRLLSCFHPSPEIVVLNYEDQTDLKYIVFAKITHPIYSKLPEYNTICDVFGNIERIFEGENRYLAYGLTSALKRISKCASRVNTNAHIYVPSLTTPTHFDLTTYSQLLNALITYVALHQNTKKILYVQERKNPRFPFRFFDNGISYILRNIKTISDTSVYAGILTIPIRDSSNIILFIFWDKTKNIFKLYDIFGNILKPSCIITTPVSTYIEIHDLYVKYNCEFYKLIDKEFYFFQQKGTLNEYSLEKIPMCRVKALINKQTYSVIKYGEECKQ